MRFNINPRTPSAPKPVPKNKRETKQEKTVEIKVPQKHEKPINITLEEKVEDNTVQEKVNDKHQIPPGYGPGVPTHPIKPMPEYPYDSKPDQLAEAYVLWQKYGGKMYTPKEALEKGTLFPELYRPYSPERHK